MSVVTSSTAAERRVRLLQKMLVAVSKELKKSSNRNALLPHCWSMECPLVCSGQTMPEDQRLVMPGR